MHPCLAFLENLGFGELVVVMGIALLLFGERLPSVARSFGKGLAEFKRSMRDSTEQVKREFEAAAGPIAEPMRDLRRELNKAMTDVEQQARLPDTVPPGFNENKLDPSIQSCAEEPSAKTDVPPPEWEEPAPAKPAEVPAAEWEEPAAKPADAAPADEAPASDAQTRAPAAPQAEADASEKPAEQPKETSEAPKA
ncbi:MAG: twin-arginine translocase TatA/TatE family subunit [Planctomycetota bacterium]|nr:twin-arginine translocase TatA/TatE family subunit [Planctomycetota bacterium]